MRTAGAVAGVTSARPAAALFFSAEDLGAVVVDAAELLRRPRLRASGGPPAVGPGRLPQRGQSPGPAPAQRQPPCGPAPASESGPRGGGVRKAGGGYPCPRKGGFLSIRVTYPGITRDLGSALAFGGGAHFLNFTLGSGVCHVFGRTHLLTREGGGSAMATRTGKNHCRAAHGALGWARVALAPSWPAEAASWHRGQRGGAPRG